MTKSYEIQLFPSGKRIQGRENRSLKEALAEASIFLRSDCGNKGHCGKCSVNKITGTGEKESIISCTYLINDNLKAEIPENALLSPHILRKAPVSFPPSFTGRTKENHTEDSYGIAVDIGTTTIAIYLCSRSNDTVLASTSLKNPQALYGDDVMSRISAIAEDKSTLGYLQKIVVKATEWGINSLLSPLHIGTKDIEQLVAVGNPTMIHIFSGVDPSPIGVSPYQPAFYEARSIDAASIGFDLHDVPVFTFPQISGFIGGDILSAALATDLTDQPDGTLLIDLGTNGELLLKHNDGILACSCAIGPAFEGAQLSCGTQAVPGAINGIEIDDNNEITRVSFINPDNNKELQPIGICGPGAINAISQMFERKIIVPSGAFTNRQTQFWIIKKDGNSGQHGVYIHQKDIRAFQLGKAALITGINLLLKEVGMARPEKIILAGAFGTHINPENMMKLGMLPHIDVIEIAGNAAGTGAIMALCDDNYITKAKELAGFIKSIELASNTDFQNTYITNLSFPDSISTR